MDHILKKKKPASRQLPGKRKLTSVEKVPDLNESTGSVRDKNGHAIKSQKSFKRQLIENPVENSLNLDGSDDYELLMERMQIEANQKIHFAWNFDLQEKNQ